MPAPIPMPVRQQIIRLRANGLTYPEIAARVNCSPRTVIRLSVRSDEEPETVPAPRYDRTAHRTHAVPPLVREQMFTLAEQHPGWGTPYLRTVLRLRHPKIDWPSERTMQRWLKDRRTAPARERRQRSEYIRAGLPHQRWQMDAVDQLPLLTGEQVSWLRLADECTGAFLMTRIFPPGALQSTGAARGSSGPAARFRTLGLPAVDSRGQR